MAMELFPLLDQFLFGFDQAPAVRPSANGTYSRKPQQAEPAGAFKREAGDGLLSHNLAIAVPSALQGLTTVFGMGTGVAPAR